MYNILLNTKNKFNYWGWLILILLVLLIVVVVYFNIVSQDAIIPIGHNAIAEYHCDIYIDLYDTRPYGNYRHSAIWNATIIYCLCTCDPDNLVFYAVHNVPVQ